MLQRISILSTFVCLVLADVKQILISPGTESTDVVNAEGRHGFTQSWKLTTTDGFVIKLICDRLQLVETDDCEGGFLEVKEATGSKKFCGGSDGTSLMSETNELTLTFSLIKSNGYVKCSATGVKKQDIEPSYKEDGDINIPLNGPAYDKMFFQPVPRDLNKKWTFTTDQGSKLSIKCSRLSFLKGSCNAAKLTVGQETICDDKEFNTVSEGNTLTVEAFSALNDEDTVLDCIVQAINGPNLDQYKNIEPLDVDSSEFGVAAGDKKTSCKCGWTNKFDQRHGGAEVKNVGEYPWVASVLLKAANAHICGGVIISPKTVLTAGHCTKKVKPSDLSVSVGSTQPSQGGQVFDVTFIRDDLHSPFYTHEKDISILFLTEKIQFSDTIGPICFDPIVPNMKNKDLTVIGWGTPVAAFHSDTLRHTHLRTIDFNTCNFEYGRKFRPESSKTRFCTWAAGENGLSHCQGDSGSPLAWLDPETNRYTLIGLVSLGKECGSNVAGVNTFVPEFYKWVHKYIRQHAREDETCRKQG